MDDFLGWLCLAAIVAGLCWAFNSARQENRWQQVERLQEEVDRLRRRSIWMEEQLRAGGWIPGPAEPPPARPSVYSPPREAQGPPPQPAATIPVARVSPVPPAPAVASRAPEPARVALPQVSPSRPVPPAKPAPQPGPTWEDRIGGQWFNWLGAVTAVFAVGLFLKWAYDMGWITPMLHLPPLAYLTLGWLVGTVLLAAGDRLRRPLPLYAQGIAGAGIATLYVTTYAGHALYGTLSPTAATVGLVAVGTAAIGMALRHNSRVIGWIGLVLAYVSPVLLGVPSGSPLSLFLYLSALNAAVLGISVARHWPPFRAAAFAATAVLYAVWYSTQYSMPHLGAALAFVGANALLFLGVVVLYPLVRRERSHDTDLAVAVLNPLLAFTGIHALLAPHHSQCLGLVALGSGGVYWLAARAIGLRRGEPDYLEQLFFSTALVFAVLAVPLQFQGRAVTAGWALIGAALSVVGFRTASLRTRVWGAVALALSLGRLALMDAWQAPSPGAAPFFNERSFSFGVVALALAAMAGVVVREWKDAGRKGETRSALMC
ncbi:MAG TPA: DUF2339 domain-containing protein, partial [Armatimonadota bacterium]|nr:DUF2339 domain-containing protein [Armatimonadota bacterium]